LENLSENTIWHAFTQGDINAFSSIFKTYYAMLNNYGLKISRNPELTEDCLQDFFVYLYDNRSKLGEVNHIKSYLFVSFRRSIFRTLKNERVFVDEVIDEGSLSSFEFSAEEIAIEQEFTAIRVNTVAVILNSLSKREREAVYLKYYSDLKVSDIAVVMEISYQSVLNNLQKAFTKLRKEIESDAIFAVLKN
jgi:RNA polymerase sigma factor (sigma-70 family)